MRKLLLIIVLAIIAGMAYFLTYKGSVPEDSTGVLRWVDNGVVSTKLVSGPVFSFKKADLYVYPLGRIFHQYDKGQAFAIRTKDGFSGALHVSAVFELDAGGAEKMCASSVASLMDVINGEAHAVLAEGFTSAGKDVQVNDVISDPSAACTTAQKAIGDELGILGLRLAALRPLAPLELTEESDRYLRTMGNAQQEQELAEHVFATAVLLEGTRASHLRTVRDSALTVDAMTRSDSMRINDLSIAQFRKDSTLHMLRFTPGYLENKRLDVIAKAIEKWDGKLAPGNAAFASPFTQLGKPSDPKANP